MKCLAIFILAKGEPERGVFMITNDP